MREGRSEGGIVAVFLAAEGNGCLRGQALGRNGYREAEEGGVVGEGCEGIVQLGGYYSSRMVRERECVLGTDMCWVYLIFLTAW